MDERKRPEYPWQIPRSPASPRADASEAERRRQDAEAFFEIEEAALEFGFPSELVYDEGDGVFRFPDGRFALSRGHADWPGLKAIGYFSEWGL